MDFCKQKGSNNNENKCIESFISSIFMHYRSCCIVWQHFKLVSHPKSESDLDSFLSARNRFCNHCPSNQILRKDSVKTTKRGVFKMAVHIWTTDWLAFCLPTFICCSTIVGPKLGSPFYSYETSSSHMVAT